MKFFVALWARDTEHKLTGTQVARFNTLRSAIEKADEVFKRECQARIGEFSGSIKSIFVAPEYLFTRSEEDDRGMYGRAVSVADASSVITQIVGLSQGLDGMLLIPGSIIYRHKLENAEGGLDGVKASLQATRNLFPKHASAEVTRLAPANKADELSLSAKMLKFEHDTNITHVIKNRVYIFLNGAVKAFYGKRGDQCEAIGTVPGVFLPGRSAGIEEIEGITFGFEICFDHDIGVLKKQSGSKKVDIHVICSASINNNLGNMNCRNGGFVLHASSDKDATTVHYKPKTGLAVPAGDGAAAGKIEVLAEEEIDGDPLKFYVIDLE